MQPRISRRASLRLLGAVTLASGASVALIEACAVEPDKPDKDRQQVLRDLVSVVIVPTYAELSSRCDALVKACQALETELNEDTLRAAQDAFRAARSSWKQSEAFYFGPAQDIALTAEAIDSWPVDGAKLDALVGGDAAVDLEAVGRLGANQRGFPGLEWVLFDSAAGDALVRLRLQQAGAGPRFRSLAVSLASDLKSKVDAVREAWGEGDEGYGHELAEAGVGSKLFERQRDGIDEVVTGMLYLAELMVMSKLAKPLGVDTDGQPKPALEEAPRSDGSLAALRDNLLGLKAVYLCERAGESGRSLSDEVRESSKDVDERFRQALDDALAAVDAAPVPFRVALLDDVAPIELVYQKVRVVKNAIAMELAGALGASIGFGYSDTD